MAESWGCKPWGTPTGFCAVAPDIGIAIIAAATTTANHPTTSKRVADLVDVPRCCCTVWASNGAASTAPTAIVRDMASVDTNDRPASAICHQGGTARDLTQPSSTTASIAKARIA